MQQRYDGHWAYAAGHGGVPAAQLVHFGMVHIAGEMVAVGPGRVGNAVDAYINKHYPFLYHIGGDEIGLADINNQDVGLPGEVGKIGRAVVADGDGAVGVLAVARKEGGRGRACYIAASYNDAMLAVGVDVIAFEHGAYAHDVWRKVGFLAKGHQPGVVRGESVDIFLGGDGMQYFLFVEVLGKRQLYDESVDRVVVVQAVDNAQQLVFGGSFGQVDDRRGETDFQAGLLFAVYIGLAGRIIAHKDDYHAWRTEASCSILAHFVSNFAFDGGGKSFAVKNLVVDNDSFYELIMQFEFADAMPNGSDAIIQSNR